MSVCHACQRECHDANLCGGCVDQLAGDLRRVPWLVAQLTITLTRQNRLGDRNGPRNSDRPLPYDHRASVDLETLRDSMWTWAHAVAEQRDVTVDSRREPVDLSRWLRRWMGAVAQHTDAADLHDEITHLVKSCVKTIDRHPELKYVGPCDLCEEDLYAFPADLIVSCKAEDCDAEYRMEERRVWLLEQAYDRLLTAAEMSRAIGHLLPGQVVLTPNRISQWASRGLRGQRLTRYLPHPQDPHSRERFRVEEVITFLRRSANLDAQPKSA